MVKFKPGDVIIYGEGMWDPPSNGIVCRVEKGMCYVEAFQHFTAHFNGQWYGLDNIRGTPITRNLRLHPDPDPIWADFCKWKLTKCP